VKEILGSHAVDVNYESVEIVRRRGSYLKYSSGNYQTDISLARIWRRYSRPSARALRRDGRWEVGRWQNRNNDTSW